MDPAVVFSSISALGLDDRHLPRRKNYLKRISDVAVDQFFVGALPRVDYLCIGSIHRTSSGSSTGSISRLTTTGSCPDRTRTHSSVSFWLALISWCGT